MALDIINEQRMIRTLFYSLVQSAELIVDDNSKCDKFVSNVAKFIKERTLRDDDTRDEKEIVSDLLETLGWKSTVINFNEDEGHGKATLGQNRFFVNEIADSKGTLLVLQALFEGIGYFLLKSPVKAKAKLSLKSSSHYEVEFSRTEIVVEQKEEEEKPSLVPVEVADKSIHVSLTIDKIFNPIFTKDIPDFMLFETFWKVVTESFVANFSADANDPVNKALKDPSMTNLSFIIMKLTENEKEEDIVIAAWPESRAEDYEPEQVWSRDPDTGIYYWAEPDSAKGTPVMAVGGGRYGQKTIAITDKGEIYFGLA